MNKEQRDYLEKYMRENNVEDTTEKIRIEKQSIQLREEIRKICLLRLKYLRDEDFTKVCDKECKFLRSHHDKLYKKLLENPSIETMELANKMICLLERIEKGDIDQNEGSFEFGNLCKKIYIDPRINENNDIVEISWDEYKKMKV